MKFFSAIILGLTIFGFTASAQRNVTPTVDTAMETDAKHNLDVARQAFLPLKKAYKQVIFRFEETYAAYPDFTGIDEFLYLAGMSSYYLSDRQRQAKGRSKVRKRKGKIRPRKAPHRRHHLSQAHRRQIPPKQIPRRRRKNAQPLKLKNTRKIKTPFSNATAPLPKNEWFGLAKRLYPLSRKGQPLMTPRLIAAAFLEGSAWRSKVNSS